MDIATVVLFIETEFLGAVGLSDARRLDVSTRQIVTNNATLFV